MKKIDYVFIIFILAALYFLAGKLSLVLLHGIGIVNIGLFASEGIAFGMLLYFGKKIWLGIFIGQFALAITNGISFVPAVEISFINSFEAVLGVYLFDTFRLHRNLLTMRDIIGLALLIIMVLQPISAIGGNVALFLDKHMAFDVFISSTFSWWFGNVMGDLLFTPFVLLLLVNHKRVDFFEYLMYSFIFGAGIYFLELVLGITNLLLLLSITTPIYIVLVYYKGIVYGTGMSVVLALVTTYSVYLDLGAFTLSSTVDNVINYNLFILAHIITVLVAGVLFEELHKHKVHLEEKIAEAIAKNEKQQLMLLQQNRLAQMGEMIAMIAHQWRQPLNNLSLSNQLIISKYNKGKLDDAIMESFKSNSKKQIQHMSTTIEDFMHFFKPQKEKKLFCITELVERTVALNYEMYLKNDIVIHYDLRDKIDIFAYENEIGQAILNILNNAKDALVESKNRVKQIDITIVEEKGYAVISIEDNAGGIDEEIIEKIFEPYFSTKSEKNGTGLGLYMTKMILEEETNAQIVVQNTNQGAKFTIYLKGVEKCF